MVVDTIDDAVADVYAHGPIVWLLWMQMEKLLM